MAEMIKPPRVISEESKDNAILDASARVGEIFPGYVILGHDTEVRMWWKGKDKVSARGLLERMLDMVKTSDRIDQEYDGHDEAHL